MGSPFCGGVMDIYRAIRELIQEKKRLDAAIGVLEAIRQAKPIEAGTRRGRKSMSAEERKQVSKRMRKYWAERRKIQQAQEQGQSRQ